MILDKAIGLADQVIGWGIAIINAHLGREATEKIPDAARATLVDEGRAPTDAELLANVDIPATINEWIPQA